MRVPSPRLPHGFRFVGVTWSDPRLVQILILSLFTVLGQTVLQFPILPQQIAIGVLTATIVEMAFALRKRVILLPASALISGLSLGLLLRPGYIEVAATHRTFILDPHNLWLPALAGFVAIASKQWITVRGKHLFNPTNFAIVLLVLLLPHDASVTPGQWGTAGAILFAVVNVGYLMTYRVHRFHLIGAFWGAYALCSAVLLLLRHQPSYLWWPDVSSGSVLLFAFFMLTDPRTSPNSRAGRVVYGILTSLLYVIFSLLHVPIPLLVALVAACMTVPWLNTRLGGEDQTWRILSRRRPIASLERAIAPNSPLPVRPRRRSLPAVPFGIIRRHQQLANSIGMLAILGGMLPFHAVQRAILEAKLPPSPMLYRMAAPVRPLIDALAPAPVHAATTAVTTTVEISDTGFVPQVITITQGTTVIWVNSTNNIHSVIADAVHPPRGTATPTNTTSPSTPTNTTSPSTPTNTTSPSTPTNTTSPSTPTNTTSPSTPTNTTSPSTPTNTPTGTTRTQSLYLPLVTRGSLAAQSANVPPPHRAAMRVAPTLPVVNGTFNSGDLLPAQSYSYQLSVVGSYGYGDSYTTQRGEVRVFPNTTTVSGTIQTANGVPIPGVHVFLQSGPTISAMTGADGSYSLAGVPVSRVDIAVDGRTTTINDGTKYPFYNFFRDIPPGFGYTITRPTFLPPVMTAPVNVPQGAVVQVTNPQKLPGTTLQADGDTIEWPAGVPHQLSIDPVPVDHAPSTLPSFMKPALLITVQPAGMRFTRPAPVTFPNADQLPPGTKVDLWSMNHATGMFESLGMMTVSSDGRTVASDPGVGIMGSSWHTAVPTVEDAQPSNPKDCRCQDPTNSATTIKDGANIVDFHLPTVDSLDTTRGLTFIYNSLTAPKVGPRGFAQTVMSANVRFGVRIVPGGNAALAAIPQTFSSVFSIAGRPVMQQTYSGVSGTVRVAAPVDLASNAVGLPTGVYTTSVRFTYSFLGSTTSAEATDMVVVNDLTTSPYGRGWSIAGLQRLLVYPGQNALLTEGGRAPVVYRIIPGQSMFQSPPNDLTTLARNTDGTFTRTSPNGDQVFFSASGYMTATSDPNGNTTAYTYDANGLLTRIVDPMGLITRLNYTSNQLTSITDPAGRITRFAHDAGNRMTSITNPRSQTTSYTYNADGLLTSQTHPNNNQSHYTYDSNGRVYQVTFANGTTRTYQQGETQGLATGTGTVPATLAVRATEIITDERGLATRILTDDYGQPTRIEDSLGRVTTIQHDNRGQPTLIRAADGAATVFTYDQRGNVLLKANSRSGALHFAYEPLHNRPISITNQLGQTTRMTYDAAGNLQTLTNPLGQRYSTVVNTRGQVTQILDPLNSRTTYSYDAATGNLASITDALGRQQQFTYDAAGNRLSTAGPGNQHMTAAYDAVGNVLQLVNTLGGHVNFTYDNNDNVTSVSDPLAHALNFQYDQMNRVTQVTNALNETTHYTYDPVGKYSSVVDGKGQTTSYTYDNAGRLAGLQPAMSPPISLAYTPADDISSLVGDGIQTNLDYSSGRADHPSSVQWQATDSRPYAGSVGYTYGTGNAMGGGLSSSAAASANHDGPAAGQPPRSGAVVSTERPPAPPTYTPKAPLPLLPTPTPAEAVTGTPPPPPEQPTGAQVTTTPPSAPTAPPVSQPTTTPLPDLAPPAMPSVASTPLPAAQTPPASATNSGADAASNTANTVVCGTITGNTTWTTAASPYELTCSVTVNPGVTLTIQPGVVVHTDGNSLNVYGTLSASGTSATHIVFGPGSNATAGGLYFGFTYPSTASSGHLSYFDLQNGGDTALQSDRATLQIDHSTFAGGTTGYGVYLSGGTATLDTITVGGGYIGLAANSANVTLTNSSINGTGNTASYGNGLYASSSTFGMTNTQVLAAGSGVALHLSSQAPLGFSTNSISGGGTVLQLDGDAINTPWITNGNTIAAGPILLNGNLATNQTWPVRPYTFNSAVTVNVGLTLTLAAGTTINSNGNSLNVYGTLQAAGTSASHIVFGPGSNATAGGLYFGFTYPSTASSGHLSYFDLQNGGNTALQSDRATLQIDHSTFAGGTTGYGVYLSGGTATLDTITVGGGYIGLAANSANVTLTNSFINGTGNTASYGNGLYASSSTFGMTNTQVLAAGSGVALHLSSQAPLGFSTNSISGGGTVLQLDGDAINTPWITNGNTIAAGPILLNGNLATNQTWPVRPYTFNSGVTVNVGLTLTLAAGTTINSNGNSLNVYGTLQAAGTSASHIVFGPGSNATAGGLYFGFTYPSTASSGHLSYFDLQNGGNTALQSDRATLQIDHSTFAGGTTGYGVYIGGGTATLDTITVGGGYIGLAANSASVTLTNSTINGTGSTASYGNGLYASSSTFGMTNTQVLAAGSGVALHLSSQAPLGFSTNSISGGGTVLQLDGDAINTPWITNGNTIAAGPILLNGNLATNQTWPVRPYTFNGAVTVNVGLTLTLAAGTTINSNGNSLNVYGTLSASGTSANHIVFGPGSNATAGGLYFGFTYPSTASSGHLSYFDLQNGGNTALQSDRATLQIDHSTFAGGTTGYGVYIGGGTATLDTITVGGGYIGLAVNSANVTLTNSFINGTGNTASYGNGLYASSSTFGMTNTQVLAAGSGVALHLSSQAPLGFSTNSISGGGTVLQLDGDAINTPWITNGNTIAAGPIVLNGNLATNQTWPARAYTISNATIAANAQLTLAPGVDLQMLSGSQLYIYGQLLAVGTAASPIHIHSASATPGPGDWSGLVFSTAPAGSRVEYALLENAVTGIYIDNSAPTIRFAAINGISGDAFILNNSPAVIDSVDLDTIGGYGVRNYTPASVATAQHVWWGDPSGPQAPTNVGALGFQVTDGVTFVPFALTPNGRGTNSGLLQGIVVSTNSNTPQRLSFAYDALNATTVMTSAGDANYSLHFAYDAAHRLSSVAPGTGQAGITSAVTRDALGRIVGQSDGRAPDNVVLGAWKQGYDLAGNVVVLTDTLHAQTTAYAYDGLNRLTQVSYPAGSTEAYSYDAAGNRTGKTAGGVIISYAYNAANELVSSSDGTIYTYDANGNLRTRVRNGGTTTFTWDSRDRLVRIDYPDSTYSTYAYDALSRRVSKREPSGATIYYVYDGLNLVQELDASGAILASFVHSARIDHPFSMTRGGHTYYYLYDRLGSVTGLMDSTGNIVASYSYDTWGNITNTSGTVQNPFRFTGREFDAESGLYFYRARYYDPQVGRFISRDPIGLAGGVNVYLYVSNNPVNFVDPWGLEDITPEEGQQIADEAKTWTGVPYYSGGGASSTKDKADCSGATWQIYKAAGFPYDYSNSKTIPENPKFRPVSTPQVGDVVQWDGHVAIYDPNAGNGSDLWSARNPKHPFGPASSKWWTKDKGAPTYYRYQKSGSASKDSCSCK